MSVRLSLLATFLLTIACIGCGSDSPFDYVDAKGAVTYEDGSKIPVGGIELRFYAMNPPEAGGAKPRPAIAHTDAEGKFDLVTSYKYGDGLIPGKHRVAIMEAVGEDKKPLIPKDYSNPRQTPLVVDTAELPFQIKVPKP
ncbi:hypothetical protein [Adhaeretor mobilis]|uniref:Carboxypeptidase regulatory-like domain-containing protein n=1 Tax=Adhaeretor mobilis TaxID=1930276 RepID=A0A517MWE0_9BACT|nr:hypothetical protein [Adhaeretor mobilis]QDS99188.1 hypothetical protein HG15A2_24800 [Adhaeretor mobilis]